MQKIIKLKNGLRIVSEKVSGVNSISIGVMIKNGSRNEDEKVNGISHFIEHMFFKGTEKRTSKQIISEVENVGGQINAFTGKEVTCYFVKSLNTHIELGLDILSDMLLNSKFDSEEIEKEKSVIIEEINMNNDLPEDILEDTSALASFGDVPLARPILGTAEKIRKLTRNDIMEFLKERYVPENAVLSICGNFDEEETLKLIEKYFLSWEKGSLVKEDLKEKEIKKGYLYKNKDIEQLHINLSLQGLPYGDEKGYALVLLNNIFGGGASSILFQKIREELGLCYSTYSYVQPYVGIGTLNIYLGLSKENAEVALKVVKEELNKFIENGITEEEFIINKEKIKANYILGLESTSAKMFANSRSLLFKGKIRTQEEVMERIDSITKEDLDYVFEHCFKKGILNASYVGPKVDVEKLNSIILS